jgi:hypothetical protein
MAYTARIYKIVNTINDDIYIGSTRTELRYRWKGHKTDQKTNPTQNGLYELMGQYPIECFRMILIEEVECQNRQIQLQHEQRYIDQLKPKLNKINPVGQKCEHDRQRYHCNDCGLRYLCEHNQYQSRCKDCKGATICEHNRRRTDCKDCKGGSICQHNHARLRCKLCKGSQICEHNRCRPDCKDCNGYNTQKVYCYDCDCEFRRDQLSKHRKSIKHLQNILPVNL